VAQESVKDRMTRSHETILMLARYSNYYWDPEAGKAARELGISTLEQQQKPDYE
jgi:hypothetical protein